MTVCIAALCQDSAEERYAVCVADRMLTAGVGDADVEYEPTMPKIFPITSAIAILSAGDAFLQREILLGVYPEVLAGFDKGWWHVRDVVELYRKHYNIVRSRRAEQEVLARYSLTFDEYTKRNRELAPTTLSEIVQALKDFDVPEAPTIFAGIDPSGAHIYSAGYNCAIQCHDATGFAAIGTGARHASSQFMLAKHSLTKALPDTLRLAYFAKKRSEVAPGVGEETDMCLLGPVLGSFKMFSADDISRLQGLYRAALKDEDKMAKKTQERIEQFVQGLKAPPVEQKTATGPSGPSGPTGE